MVIEIIITLMIMLVILCLPYLYVIYMIKFPKFSYVKILKGETFNDQKYRIKHKAKKLTKLLTFIVFIYLMVSILFMAIIPIQFETTEASEVTVWCCVNQKITIVIADGTIFTFSDLKPEKYKYYFLDKYKNIKFELSTTKNTFGAIIIGPSLKITFPIEEEIIF